MKLRNTFIAILSAFSIMILILDGKTALAGAQAGLELCIKVIIPSLFPFLFLCTILTDSLWNSPLLSLKSIYRKLGIPQGGESLLITATLGGYPAGAQIIGQSYRDGKLAYQDAVHLLTFCSNAGPAFLFGITATAFSDKAQIWILWLIQILSALLTALINHTSTVSSVSLSRENRTITQILTQTAKTMGILCGWIVLFQMVIIYLSRWVMWFFPEEIQVIVTGILELSSGCCALYRINSDSVRFIVCSALLSFGGICVLMQTASVIAPLPLWSYFCGKVMQTAVSVFLSVLYLSLGLRGLIIVSAVVIFLLSHKKEVDLSLHRVYNKTAIIRR